MEEILSNLEKRGFKPYFAKDKAEALETVKRIIPEGATIGFGGSVTVAELGLVSELGKTHVLYTREKPDGKTDDEIMSLSMNSDWYICSANAISLSGDIVNIDGRANRVAATLYGTGNVLIIAGINKICQTLESAIERAQNVAAPLNCKRLNKKTPCTVTGRCQNCNSPDTICRATVILHHPTTAHDVHILIVGENLGY